MTKIYRVYAKSPEADPTYRFLIFDCYLGDGGVPLPKRPMFGVVGDGLPTNDVAKPWVAPFVLHVSGTLDIGTPEEDGKYSDDERYFDTNIYEVLALEPGAKIVLDDGDQYDFKITALEPL